MISRDTIDEIQRLPILDVVSKFYRGKLKPQGSGSSHRGLSPWSEEKTPSFYVVPPKNIFKDFSSGNGGGPIHFVMLHENLSYPLAVKAIAREFSIAIEEDEVKQDPKEIDFIEELYTVNRLIAKTYAELLWNSHGDQSGFHSLADQVIIRRFTDETICQWQLGYAPDEWKYISSKIIQQGFHKHGLELGIIRDKNGQSYDLFRHRLIFPIHDECGHIVAFAGRYLPGMQHAKEKDAPKYINSPESKIFVKSRVLYGLHFAIHAIQKEKKAILVEGYTDVISMHQAGFINTVSSGGTSLTVDQVQLLKRYTSDVTIAMDGDDAGRNAMDRCTELFLNEGFHVDICPLPEGKDPDDFIRTF